MKLCHLYSEYYSDDDFNDLEFSISFSLIPDLTDKIWYGTVLSPIKKTFEKNLNITAKSERNESTEAEHDFMYFQQTYPYDLYCLQRTLITTHYRNFWSICWNHCAVEFILWRIRYLLHMKFRFFPVMIM